jgi:nitroreductase
MQVRRGLPVRRDVQAPVADLIKRRYSCRTYLGEPVAAGEQHELREFLAENTIGPLGSRARFSLLAASPGDSEALRHLGTYGFIKGATGFLVGAVRRGPKDLEDYGYLLERIILFATGLGLGTCWLGGTFTKSRFAARFGGLDRYEAMPAVVSLGYIGDDGTERIREREEGSRRLPSSSLFFEERFDRPLTLAQADGFGTVLEGVRMAPSASNKQPWRIVRRGREWHFYLQRTRGYGKGSPIFVLLRIADLQRIDLGIAMCHFDLAVRELGLTGAWAVHDPGIATPGHRVEYTATWVADE